MRVFTGNQLLTGLYIVLFSNVFCLSMKETKMTFCLRGVLRILGTFYDFYHTDAVYQQMAL